MTRHFGIPNTNGRLTEGAFHQPSALRADTPRDPYPLPAQSLRPDPLTTDAERSDAAGKFVVVFLSLCFLIPMLCAGIMLHFQ